MGGLISNQEPGEAKSEEDLEELLELTHIEELRAKIEFSRKISSFSNFFEIISSVSIC